MNDKTGGNKGLRRAAALAAVAAVAVGATACGGIIPSPRISASGEPANAVQLVALAHCMRSHGAPDFPDPSASGGFNDSNGRLDLGSSQVQGAYGACRHLLPGGGPDISRLQQEIQRKQQQALRVLRRFSHCMRGHGVPGFPDPASTGLNLNDAGLGPASPQFQAAVQACQHGLPAGMHISASRHESVRTHPG